MKLQEAKDIFYESSATLSDNVRKLSLGGIAIIWILRVADKAAAGIPFSKVLLVPLIAFVVGLLLDALQYLYKTIAWWLYHKAKYQAGLAADAEIDPPMSINAPTWVFFGGKAIACGVGYWVPARVHVEGLLGRQIGSDSFGHGNCANLRECGVTPKWSGRGFRAIYHGIVEGLPQFREVAELGSNPVRVASLAHG